jgi:hypothetical protein
MKFEIAPMNVGEILVRAFSLFTARFKLFLAIEMMGVLPTLVIQLVLPEFSLNTGGSLVALMPMLILGPIGAAAMLHIIAQEYLGQPVSLAEALQFALGKFLPLLGTSLLAGFGIFAGMMACCIPGIYLYVIWAFVSQIVVMENLAVTMAMGRSKDLIAGYFWHVFVVIFIVAIIVGAISGPINLALTNVLPFNEVIPGNANNPFPQVNLTSYPNFVIVTLVSTFLNGVGQIFTAICTTVLYFDIRNRKEAFDLSQILAWMDQYRDWRDEPEPAEAPPMTPAAPETGIKQVGDVVPPALPAETRIKPAEPARPANDLPPEKPEERTGHG